MPIPTTRPELIERMSTAYRRLRAELDRAGSDAADTRCVEDWTVKDLLAVRAWWTDRVVDWIEAGQRGEWPVTPAPGYRWSETPRLNAAIVETARQDSYPEIVCRLDQGYRRAFKMASRLSDEKLFKPAVFGWAGKLPISRWLSINTARQYTTARAYIRRAITSLTT